MDTTKSGKFMVDKNGYSYWSANGDTQASDSGAQTGDQFRGEIYTGVLDR